MRIAKTIDSVHAGPGAIHGSPSLNAWMKPIRQRAEHGACEVADAAEHRGGEGDQTDREARVVADRLVVEREQDARRAGESARDHECERDRPVDVDAHHARPRPCPAPWPASPCPGG